MRKPYLFLIVLCICMFLCACRADDPDNLFGTEQPSETTQMKVTEEPTCPVVTDQGYYQYGNMQKNLPSGNFMRYGDSVLFKAIYNNHSYLCMYDMSTGKVSSLCKDATCTHSSNNCISSDVFGTLEVYKQEIYSMNGDGQIVKLKGNSFEEILSGVAGTFWHSNDNLYVKTADASLLVYENGKSIPRTLVEEYTAYWNVVFGRYLYGQGQFGDDVIRVDLQSESPVAEVIVENAIAIIDGKHIYYADVNDNYHLYRCNMDGSASVLLLEKPILPASINFDDEYFYFRLFTNEEIIDNSDSHDLYRFSKSDPTQIEKIATLSESIYQVFTVPEYDKIFVLVETPMRDSTLPPLIYVMGRDGSDPQLLELPDF